MKISFLCSSFEDGRDGVGDYVRQFMTHLAALGHECQVIALADRFVGTSGTASERTSCGEAVRIPVAKWNAGEIEDAKSALNRFAPDWVSLQMVNYGFDRRGLLWKSSNLFRRLAGYGRRHLMFHELWIGEGVAEGLKARCLGALQRRSLLSLARSWAPDIIHTSNPLYRELLRRHGIGAEELPLPGNIPIHSVDRIDARNRLLARLELREEPDHPLMLVGVFGSIHREWQDAAVLAEINEHCRQLDRKLVLLQIGRAGADGEVVWQSLRTEMQGKAPMVALGELSAIDISIFLQALDFGIATSPWSLAGKSGTVAAMLDHGLPVLVTRDDLRLRRGATPEPTSTPFLYKLDHAFTQDLGRSPTEKPSPLSRTEMYRLFLQSLENHR